MQSNRASSRVSVETIARRVLVSGKVQGVGFRYTLAEKAQSLHLSGWCRNLPDGRVEAWMQGSRQAIELVMAWMAQGPPGAVVDEIESESQAVLEPMLSESVELFEIRK